MHLSQETSAFILAPAAALLSFAIVPMLHVLIMRIWKKQPYALHVMIACFCISALLFTWISSLKPDPPGGIHSIISGAAALLCLWLLYAELMFKLYRGFSHTLLTDIVRLAPASADDLMRDYAEGTRADGMMKRRMNVLVASGMITQVGNHLSLTPKGRRSAHMTSSFKSMLRLGRGG